MTIGAVARKVLGKRFFPMIARYYRRIFVDFAKVTQSLEAIIPARACVLDIGGGDGELLNHLLAVRPDIEITMIDLKADIGSLIYPAFRDRVALLSQTSMRDYRAQHLPSNHNRAYCLIVSDVLHHIPQDDRAEFFHDLAALMQQLRAILIIKEIEPGYMRSFLSYLSDRYISGDKQVSLLSRSDLAKLLRDSFGAIHIIETELFRRNRPNYCMVIEKYAEDPRHYSGV